MYLVGENYIRKHIEEVGETITIRVQSGNYNEWGDYEATSATDYNVTAYVQTISAEDVMQSMGEFKSGDIRIFMSGSYVDIAQRENLVYWQNKWYRIKEVVPYYVGSELCMLEVTAEKV